MDYKYTICFDYDGKYHECSFEYPVELSQSNIDENILMNWIKSFIASEKSLEGGKLVTNAVIFNEEDTFKCGIPQFKASSK